jgi:hypothetical protein
MNDLTSDRLLRAVRFQKMLRPLPAHGFPLFGTARHSRLWRLSCCRLGERSRMTRYCEEFRAAKSRDAHCFMLNCSSMVAGNSEVATASAGPLILCNRNFRHLPGVKGSSLFQRAIGRTCGRLAGVMATRQWWRARCLVTARFSVRGDKEPPVFVPRIGGMMF